MTKSEKGSLGFTVTKGNDDVGCYIHDIVQDPAKSDGRLQPGDRLIKVRQLKLHSRTYSRAKGIYVKNERKSTNFGSEESGLQIVWCTE